MTRITLAAWAALTVLVSFGGGRAAAQPYAAPRTPPGFGTTGRPAFSPYLNLNLAGNPVALNYYGIVRPQFQARAEFQSLEQQEAANRQAIADTGTSASGLPTTGHPIAFQNLGGYFMNMNPQQGGAFGAGGGGFGGGSGYSFGGMGAGGSMQGGGAASAGAGLRGGIQPPRRRR
jgi:hypothetical protein